MKIKHFFSSPNKVVHVFKQINLSIVFAKERKSNKALIVICKLILDKGMYTEVIFVVVDHVLE